MAGLKLGNLPSWVTVVMIGIGIWWGISNGMLDPAYALGDSIIRVEELGSLLVAGGLLLGSFYFLKDVSNKV